MASTHFLLQSSFNSNPMLQQNFRNIIALERKYYYPCCIEVSTKFNIKCFFIMRDKNGVTWRPMENVVKASFFLYDHHHHASRCKMSGQESSSSEVYNTQTSSPAASSYPRNPVRYYAQLVFALTVLTFPVVLMSYLIIQSLIPAQTSVLKLQVGLLSTNRSLQSDLKRIAAAVSTSGLNYALQEATLALLRHPDYCISGYSSVDVKRSLFECDKLFNRFSIEERSKFDVVNANDIGKKSATSQSSNNEYIVVTIIVVVDGVSKLPPIRSSAQLKNALQILASIPSRDIKKVKMFWNPQQENNFLTAQELLEDYALLNPI
ncbi:hypothetical protein HanXRQr2_Chr15g0703271 [Helianthus annuus]|uniref:Uncharacterized protein n=1 Tax=Helianthus annuus TaxID=4232 RepID=A0A9K3E1M0_HELAN|nr:uncharacterized protein LOC110885132 isoform X1 [Helianthus annuus]XP_021988518.1 uncharacterized protein LOC110885132 isoform X1 [Helianthus annuus]KAF5765390.1 hypothetical protein HanXRQr2_Chr15g0703271 [Helianthus annuus]KAJ0473813.1 hypothetical protein HanHA89_Chr15g0622671 [Helianthus annuus]KAJ0832084.1 hypothetical protein HanPSC8_Chr15g0674721 [Helianthus annuus]